MRYDICAVIVTYNRKEYLLNLLNALSIQTYSLSTIYILDNHSKDGTKELLEKEGVISKSVSANIESIWHNIKIKYFYNDSNAGGAGGFEKIFKIASDFQHDFLWSMDDDVLPEQDCLEVLISKIDEEHKVVIPSRSDDKFVDHAVVAYDVSNPFLITVSKRIKIAYTFQMKKECVETFSFPFEGPLFSMDIIKIIGYPDSKYFIQFDDSDYARRCLSQTNIWFVNSACLHKQIIPDNKTVFSWKEYYGYRNCFIYDKKYGKNVGVRKLRPFLIMLFSYMSNKYRKHDILKANAVLIAYKDAVSGKIGKTVIPGKLEEYLREHHLKTQ